MAKKIFPPFESLSIEERLSHLRAINEGPADYPEESLSRFLLAAALDRDEGVRNKAVETLFWIATAQDLPPGERILSFQSYRENDALKRTLIEAVNHGPDGVLGRMGLFVVASVWSRDSWVVNHIQARLQERSNEADRVDYAKVLIKGGYTQEEADGFMSLPPAQDPSALVPRDVGKPSTDTRHDDSALHSDRILADLLLFLLGVVVIVAVIWYLVRRVSRG